MQGKYYALYGKGFYFTSNKDKALARARKGNGDKLIQGYINITKPFIVGKTDIKPLWTYLKENYGIIKSNITAYGKRHDLSYDPLVLALDYLKRKSIDTEEVLTNVGFDGIIDTRYGESASEYIVFDAN